MASDTPLGRENSRSGAVDPTHNPDYHDEHAHDTSALSESEKARSSAPTPESASIDAQMLAPRRGVAEAILTKLPPWLSAGLQSRRAWKLFVRCWIASFASFVIILPDKSLRTLGNAGFFAVLSSLFVPPNVPVQAFFFVVSMAVTGMLVGWAFGAATMRAAFAARSQTLLNEAYTKAAESAAGAANPDAIFRLDVFKGFFLDIRSSVTYGAMFSVFSFLFAAGRAYRPRLLLFFTFAQILLDVICTIGPLLPAPNYTIISSFLISTASYIAIGCLCCVLIFPETMNHSYLDSVVTLLGSIKQYNMLYDSILKLAPQQIAEDRDKWVRNAIAHRPLLFAKLNALELKSPMINAEFSWGRWNGSDARGLEEPLRNVVFRIGGFYTFPKLFGMYSSMSLSQDSPGEGTKEKQLPIHLIDGDDKTNDTEIMRQLHSRRLKLETQHNVRMEDILPLLQESTACLRAACTQALGACEAFIEEINTHRWTRDVGTFLEKERALDAAAEHLRHYMNDFRNEKRFALIEPYKDILRAADEQAPSADSYLPIRSLALASSFAAQLYTTAEALVNLAATIQTTSAKRRKNRLWAPSSLRVVLNLLLRRGRLNETEKALAEGAPAEPAEDESDDDDEDEGEEEKAKAEKARYRRDPDSRPPTNAFQKIMNGVHGVYKWTKTAEALFAAKYTVLSILLWLPSVFHTSAYLYYVQKGVWALIMGQMFMTVYASDQIYDALLRLLGTVAGLVLGLIAWYAGNGHGIGNPYGAAVAFGVVLIPTIILRLNAPPALLSGTIVFNATFVLIVGYSWIDGHLPLVGSPGIGREIAWKRFVLVMIGCAGSSFFMVFPPTSGRKVVRLRNAAAISELSGICSLLMSVWICDIESDGSSKIHRTQQDSNVDAESTAVIEKGVSNAAAEVRPQWIIDFRKRAMALMIQLSVLRQKTATAKFEGNIRGAWPAEEYSKLLEHEMDILVALGQLASALHHLSPSWRISLRRRAMILNPNFITDLVSIFSLVSHSLRTAQPMHQILPSSLLDQLIYHQRCAAPTHAQRRREEEMSYSESVPAFEFIYFSAGITAASQVIRALDEMHSIVKRLCGEIPFPGFSEWKSAYGHNFS